MIRPNPTLTLALMYYVSFPADCSSWLATYQRTTTTLLSHLSLTRNHDRAQIRLDDGEYIDVISRSVNVQDDWFVTIWEKYQPAATVDHYWNTQSRSVKALDPFGLVNWPGSIVASQELLRYRDEIENTTVLIIGAGTGVEVQVVAMLNAKKVIATDYNPTTLKLLEYGVSNAGLDNVVTTQLFDLFSTDPLPDCDVLIAADVMYSERLSSIICDRCREARQRAHPPKILVSDSQRFADFVPQLQRQLGDDSIGWEYRGLDSFTGSGVMIDDDQTYDVKARVLAIGWARHSELG
jgi:predicted nicotinamide N-methyase